MRAAAKLPSDAQIKLILMENTKSLGIIQFLILFEKHFIKLQNDLNLLDSI